MKSTLFVFTLFFTILNYGQVKPEDSLVDTKIAKIPASTSTTAEISNYINTNFKTEDDKIRAVFYWTASNISYNVADMYTVNFEETPQERLEKALKTRKGICADYAMIFNEIANLVGIKSIVIEGYTKQNGKVDVLAHAWCAAKIDAKWYLFDATWGSGYVNNNKYTRKINNTYFKVLPSQMIATHMPFDYLWQFINYPVSNQEFIEGKTQVNKTKKNFDFINEITKYESLNKTDQLFESSQRMEKNGIKNQLILQAYTYTKTAWNNERQNEINSKYNEIMTQYNEAINELNDFIYYRNNKFKPALSDEEIKEKIQNPKNKLQKCQDDLFKMGTLNNATILNNKEIMKKAIADALAQSETHLQFVNNYLSKSKLVRKTMFSKISWFGVPLN